MAKARKVPTPVPPPPPQSFQLDLTQEEAEVLAFLLGGFVVGRGPSRRALEDIYFALDAAGVESKKFPVRDPHQGVYFL